MAQHQIEIVVGAEGVVPRQPIEQDEPEVNRNLAMVSAPIAAAALSNAGPGWPCAK